MVGSLSNLSETSSENNPFFAKTIYFEPIDLIGKGSPIQYEMTYMEPIKFETVDPRENSGFSEAISYSQKIVGDIADKALPALFSSIKKIALICARVFAITAVSIGITLLPPPMGAISLFSLCSIGSVIYFSVNYSKSFNQEDPSKSYKMTRMISSLSLAHIAIISGLFFPRLILSSIIFYPMLLTGTIMGGAVFEIESGVDEADLSLKA